MKTTAFEKIKNTTFYQSTALGLTLVLSLYPTQLLADEWDGPGSADNDVVDGGSGIWDNTTANWTLDGGTTNTVWTPGATAEFTAGSGTIDLQDTVEIDGLTFSQDYTVSDVGDSGSTLELTGNTIIDVDAGVSAVIETDISESADFRLEKTGLGSLAFRGTSAHSDGTKIVDGTFSLTGSLVGGFENDGADVEAEGEISGVIENKNAASFEVTGDLESDNSFTNEDTAQLSVTGGDFTGITTLTNDSTNAIGIEISENRTLRADLVENKEDATVDLAGTLAGSTGITNEGTIDTSSGTGTLSGDISNSGTISGGAVTISDGELTNSGTLSGARIATTGVLTNQTGMVSNITNRGTGSSNTGTISGLTNAAGSFNNTGTLSGTTRVTGGTLSTSSDLDDAAIVSGTGVLNIVAGVTAADISYDITNTATNDGTIELLSVSNGTVTNNDTVGDVSVTGGILENSAGANITEVTSATSGSIENEGDIGNATIDGAILNNLSTGRVTSTLTQGGGVVNNDGFIAAADVSDGVLNNKSGGSISGTLSQTGGEVNNAGTIASAEITGGTLTNSANGTVTTTATIRTGGTLATDFGAVGSIENDNGALETEGAIAGDYDNDGSDELSLAGDLSVSGTLTNTSSEAINLDGNDLTVGLLDNDQTVNADGSTINGDIENSGTISGSFTVRNSTVNSTGTLGDVTVENSSLLAVQTGTAGAITHRGTGTSTNAGTIDSLSTFAGSFVNTGTIDGNASVNGSSLDNQNSIGGSLRLTNGATVTNSGTVTGLTTVTDGMLTSTGTLAGGLTNNDTADVQGTINGTLTNMGALNLTGIVTGVTRIENSDMITIEDGEALSAQELINNAGGTLLNDGSLTSDTVIENAGDLTTNNALTGGVDNSGDLNAQNSLVGSVTNRTGANFIVTGDMMLEGTVNNETGGSVMVNPAAELAVEGLQNAGSFDIGADATLTSDTEIENTGTVTAAGDITGDIDNQAEFESTANVEGAVQNDGEFEAVDITGNVDNKLDADLMATSITGNVGNEGTLAATDITGTVVNDGTLTAMDITGNVENNGTLTATDIMGMDAVASVKNTGELTTTGTLSGGLENSNEVNVQGSVLGPIINMSGGTFNVTGPLVADSNFTNEFDATLIVPAQPTSGLTRANLPPGFTGTGFESINVLENSGTISVSQTGGLSGTTLSNLGSGDITNSGIISFDDISNASGGTIVNTGTLEGSVSNSGTLTQNGTLNGSLFNSGTVFQNGDIDGSLTNTGRLDMGVSSVSSDLENSGQLNILSDATVGGTFSSTGGSISATDSATITTGSTSLSNTVIDLRDGGAPTLAQIQDTLEITGQATGTGKITLLVQADLSANNPLGEQLGDILKFTDGFDGQEVEIFIENISDEAVVLQDNELVLIEADGIENATSISIANLNANADATTPDGPVSFAALNTNPSVEYVSNANGAAGTLDLVPSGAASFSAAHSGISSMQQIVGTIVNRPTSPYISSKLSFGEDDLECGIGTWGRFTGGNVNAQTSSASPGRLINSDISVSYGGGQVGVDYRCDTFDPQQWNYSGGLTFGFNKGSVGQSIANVSNSGATNESISNSTLNSDFDQAYAGGYLNASVGNWFGDFQIGYDKTDFKISDSVDQYQNDKVDATTTTVGGSIGYAFALDNNLFLVPQAGFRLSRTKYGTLMATGASAEASSKLSFNDRTSKIGFAGFSVGQTSVSEDETAVTNKFLTFTAYNDFGEDATAELTTSGGQRTISSEKIGPFGELSAGINYSKILDEGQFGNVNQVDASIRADYKFGSQVDGLALTAQVRFQF